jgi:hypothetical protein
MLVLSVYMLVLSVFMLVLYAAPPEACTTTCSALAHVSPSPQHYFSTTHTLYSHPNTFSLPPALLQHYTHTLYSHPILSPSHQHYFSEATAEELDQLSVAWAEAGSPSFTPAQLEQVMAVYRAIHRLFIGLCIGHCFQCVLFYI